MSISLNWQPIVGGILLCAGVLAGGVQWWRSRPATTSPPSPVKPAKGEPPRRSADAPAPAGAVEWVEDICSVIQGAPDSLILSVLRKGGSRESALIAERETRKPSEPTA